MPGPACRRVVQGPFEPVSDFATSGRLRVVDGVGPLIVGRQKEDISCGKSAIIQLLLHRSGRVSDAAELAGRLKVRAALEQTDVCGFEAERLDGVSASS